MEAAVYSPGWTQVGSNISMTEVSSGLYSADMPAASAGCYGVIFINTTPNPDIVVASGVINWDGSAEICEVSQNSRLKEVWQDRGLDSSNPKTVLEVTPAADYDEDVGSIHKDVVKAGATTTITRS